MIEIEGQYGIALVFNEKITEIAEKQIKAFMNNIVAENAKVRIMPDVHAGQGCVIGFTSTFTDRIVPNLIGVDIGCGVCAWNLGKPELDFRKLDTFIRKSIPHGFKIREHSFNAEDLFEDLTSEREINYEYFLSEIERICNTQNQDINYVLQSMGSLGGGNHFIEVDRNDHGVYWLLIHSGSRNFGSKIAEFHQICAQNTAKTKVERIWDEAQKKMKRLIAEAKAKGVTDNLPEIIAKTRVENNPKKWKPTGLEYLEGSDKDSYIKDMQIAQIYAQLNRRIMGYQIIESLGLDYFKTELVESVHNYINFNDRIIRKGSISAHEGEKVLIPLNMADGTILGLGKGVEDWNYSAPHGAGRKMSRNKARKKIPFEEYKEKMKTIWSSCVSEVTLDESPQAYKSASEIITYLKPSVQIISIMMPVYNFKSDLVIKKFKH